MKIKKTLHSILSVTDLLPIAVLTATVFVMACQTPHPPAADSPISVEQETGTSQSAIEIILPPGTLPDSLQAAVLLNGLNMASAAFYVWENHLMLFGKLGNTDSIGSLITKQYPGSSVKIYDTPFYEFNRKRCQDSVVAGEWDHILLTANLVADTVLQNEYLDYHATQFEKWPEVSNGFCNAGFQQLLLFKNGRQLLLVISIPKAVSLDELNPKTTDNNPRVDDWNALMKKYQEGIEGTKPGETWVFLTPLIKGG